MIFLKNNVILYRYLVMLFLKIQMYNGIKQGFIAMPQIRRISRSVT